MMHEHSVPASQVAIGRSATSQSPTRTAIGRSAQAGEVRIAIGKRSTGGTWGVALGRPFGE